MPSMFYFCFKSQFADATTVKTEPMSPARTSPLPAATERTPSERYSMYSNSQTQMQFSQHPAGSGSQLQGGSRSQQSGSGSQQQQQQRLSLVCPLCNAPLASLIAARSHLERHYPRDSPVCPVSSCSRHFAHPNSVRNHMRIKHPMQWRQMKAMRWGAFGGAGSDAAMLQDMLSF